MPYHNPMSDPSIDVDRLTVREVRDATGAVVLRELYAPHSVKWLHGEHCTVTLHPVPPAPHGVTAYYSSARVRVDQSGAIAGDGRDMIRSLTADEKQRVAQAQHLHAMGNTIVFSSQETLMVDPALLQAAIDASEKLVEALAAIRDAQRGVQ
jgi:hypothetical protein